jgi:DNA-binding XRE family transcriptional regulator
MPIDEHKLYALLGGQIRNAREAAGLKQEEVAHRVGLERTSITNIEKGTQKPPLHVVFMICSVVGLEAKAAIPTLAEVQHGLVAVQVDGETKMVGPKTAGVIEGILEEVDSGKDQTKPGNKGRRGAGRARLLNTG